MSLLSSLYTGVSGLQSFGNSLQVVGDNIANVSTIGFKGSRAEFSALLSQSVSGLGGVSRIGRGVALSNVSPSFSQGSFSNTDRLTDLGINGGGFFVLSDGTSRFYTRDGEFSVDKNGFLVNPTGLRVQGTRFDPSGVSLGIGDLTVDAVNAPPRPTGSTASGTGADFDVNLDASAAIPAAFSATSALTAQTTSNYSTTVSVFDSLGNSHAATVYFRKSIAADPTGTPAVNTSTWEWFATVDGAEVTNASSPAGAPFVGASGTLVFDLNGNMTSQTTAGSSFDFTGATAAQAIGFDFTGSTQFASASTVRAQSQGGFADGGLNSIAIGEDGTVTGFFSNGQNRAIGQITLADFANPQGLIPAGSSLYRESLDSGVPILGGPQTGGLGSISSFTLELSNVDLADEFVNLVTMQRAFQANSKIITTVDQLLNEVVNIIR